MYKLRFALLTLLFSTLILAELNAQQWGLYTLIAAQNATTASLIDTNSNTYHTWTFSSNAKTGYSSYLLSDGSILRTVAYTNNQVSNTGGQTGEVQKSDWNSNVTWTYVYSTSTECLHHDICPMPNGNILMIVFEVKSASAAVQAGCSRNMSILNEKIIEVQPTGSTTGTIVWQWSFWDHLCQNYNSAKDNYVSSIAEHPELLNINYNTSSDWLHANGIDYNATLDQVVISSHYLNEFYVIDHSTTTAQAATHSGGNSGHGGDFLYRWGNPAAYSTSGTTDFDVIHDAHWVPSNCPNANYLVGFNNNGISQTQSCIDLVSPPYNGYTYSKTDNTQFAPTTYSQRISCNGHSRDMGSSQQLPNGNTLICIAQTGTVYEINSAGTTLWTKTINGTLPKAYRYAASYLSTSLVATASASASSICKGATTTLSATASGGTNYSYSWTSSPSGFTSTLQSPTASPTITTIYTVTVTSGTNTTTANVTVNVNSLPTATATANGSTTICSGGSVTLKANTGTGLTYQWLLNSTNISGATTSSYNASESGSYSVIVTNSNGCVNTSNSVEVILNVPVATINANSSATICVGNSVSLQANTGTGLSYQWLSDGLDISGATLSNYSATENGSYSVVVTNSYGCAKTSNAVIVKVNALPTANAGNDVSIEKGESTILTASGGITYLWNTGEKTANITVSPSSTTTYTVIVTDANGCNAQDYVVVTVKGTTISVSADALRKTICRGESTQLTSSVTGATGTVNYIWTSNVGDFSSSIQNPLVSPKETTVYTLSVANGTDTATSTVTITVNDVPDATISAKSATEFCSGDSVKLYANSCSDCMYQWFNNNIAISNANNYYYFASGSGSYSLVVFNTSECSDTSDVISVIVHPLPASPTITFANDTLFSSYGYKYTWYYGTNIISEATDKYYYPQQLGYYSVKITDENGCVSEKATYHFSQYSVYNDVNNEIVNIYPNPTTGLLNITINNKYYDNEIRVLNIYGRELLNTNSREIDLSSFEKGTYYVKIISNGNTIIVKKIVLIK